MKARGVIGGETGDGYPIGISKVKELSRAQIGLPRTPERIEKILFPTRYFSPPPTTDGFLYRITARLFTRYPSQGSLNLLNFANQFCNYTPCFSTFPTFPVQLIPRLTLQNGILYLFLSFFFFFSFFFFLISNNTERDFLFSHSLSLFLFFVLVHSNRILSFFPFFFLVLSDRCIWNRWNDGNIGILFRN